MTDNKLEGEHLQTKALKHSLDEAPGASVMASAWQPWTESIWAGVGGTEARPLAQPLYTCLPQAQSILRCSELGTHTAPTLMLHSKQLPCHQQLLNSTHKFITPLS